MAKENALKGNLHGGTVYRNIITEKSLRGLLFRNELIKIAIFICAYLSSIVAHPLLARNSNKSENNIDQCNNITNITVNAINMDKEWMRSKGLPRAVYLAQKEIDCRYGKNAFLFGMRRVLKDGENEYYTFQVKIKRKDSFVKLIVNVDMTGELFRIDIDPAEKYGFKGEWDF